MTVLMGHHATMRALAFARALLNVVPGTEEAQQAVTDAIEAHSKFAVSLSGDPHLGNAGCWTVTIEETDALDRLLNAAGLARWESE